MRHTDDFLVTILRKVFKTLVLARVMEDNPYDQKTQYARRENFKIYKIKQDEDPSDVLEDNNAVSGIIDDQGRMMLCVEHVGDSTRDIALYPVVFNKDQDGQWRYDLWYSQAEIGPASEVWKDRKEVAEKAADFFLMLRPIAVKDRHTVICRSWRVRDQRGKFRLPTPSKGTLTCRS